MHVPLKQWYTTRYMYITQSKFISLSTPQILKYQYNNNFFGQMHNYQLLKKRPAELSLLSCHHYCMHFICSDRSIIFELAHDPSKLTGINPLCVQQKYNLLQLYNWKSHLKHRIKNKNMFKAS